MDGVINSLSGTGTVRVGIEGVAVDVLVLSSIEGVREKSGSGMIG
jgi:hypothetical protein